MIEGKTVDGEAAEEQVVEDALAVEKKSGSAAVSCWQMSILNRILNIL